MIAARVQNHTNAVLVFVVVFCSNSGLVCLPSIPDMEAKSPPCSNLTHCAAAGVIARPLQFTLHYYMGIKQSILHLYLFSLGLYYKVSSVLS
ncbi:hypothetical protein SeMB42_g07111 [Synchytrium endobioticum]|uniref:Uncharacterized protein n=1 Tax=Synchytrium endobioticum TaxID=286115 RepID=A0A507CA60_9FUNG|nr:hypothetical protein SeMB42_g07115 [Synchytrium endobioticum]TPX36061.1 hypothetical protein SeMB42_g07111 [Synchytrium endobioticum]